MIRPQYPFWSDWKAWLPLGFALLIGVGLIFFRNDGHYAVLAIICVLVGCYRVLTMRRLYRQGIEVVANVVRRFRHSSELVVVVEYEVGGRRYSNRLLVWSSLDKDVSDSNQVCLLVDPRKPRRCVVIGGNVAVTESDDPISGQTAVKNGKSPEPALPSDNWPYLLLGLGAIGIGVFIGIFGMVQMDIWKMLLTFLFAIGVFILPGIGLVAHAYRIKSKERK